MLTAFYSFSQTPNTSSSARVVLKGTVIDQETKEPLEYATVVVKPLNGDQITGGITDQKGHFTIEVSPGKYDISIEFISFKSKSFKNVEILKTVDLGVIELEIDAQSLDEVEIIAEKSTVEIRLDKKIYNVGKDMTVKGGSASDVLENVPSVTVDQEGTVSLRGNENVQILINGKPSGMVGLSGTDALRQLPADAIEKVEVITSPSARYEAEGTAGILNIVLRKGKIQGFNGSVSANAGTPDNYGLSTNLNYRIKKFNFFNNTAYSYSNAPGNGFSNVTYFDENGAVLGYRNETNETERKNNRFNTNIGLEYFLSDKTTLTGSYFYRDSNGDDLTPNYTNNYDSNYLLTSKNTRTDSETEDDTNSEYSFNLTHNFNDKGHDLTFDFQYGYNKENQYSYITDIDTYPTDFTNNPEKTATEEKNNQYLIKSDYVLPIGENSQFEAGFKVDLYELESDYLVEDYDPNSGDFVVNYDYTNALRFQQNIYAFYSQYGTKFNKTSILLGLRSETTDRTIELLQTGENNHKTWTELFPTVNIGIEINDDENITIGYNRRLRRPRSRYLNPFESRESETNIRKGNVNLNPTYTGAYDVGYYKRWNKFTLNTSIYYQHATNTIEWIQTEELREVNGSPTLVIVRTPVNLGTQDRYGFEFTTNWNPFSWWKITNGFNFFKVITTGDYDDVNYDSNSNSWFTRLSSTINLPANIDWQTSAFYMGPTQGAQTDRKSMLSVNLALSKDILNDKATIALNVSDLFNSRKMAWTTETPTTYSDSERQWRQRQVMLDFTYRFNQKKKRQQRSQNDDGGGDEMF